MTKWPQTASKLASISFFEPDPKFSWKIKLSTPLILPGHLFDWSSLTYKIASVKPIYPDQLISETKKLRQDLNWNQFLGIHTRLWAIVQKNRFTFWHFSINGPQNGGQAPPRGSFLKIYQFSSIVAHYLCRKVSQYEYRSFIHIICTSRTISLKISKNLIMCAFFGILGMGLSNEKIFW